MRIIILMTLLLAGLLLWTADLSFEHLKAFYETPQSELVKTPESLIFTEDQPSTLDNAPTLVLIHGTASSLQTWDEWTRLLKPQLRVVRLDLPGLGLSGAPNSGDYADRAEVQRIEQWLALKKIDHFILAGHDLGARLAWMYTNAHPEQVSHLILLSPQALTPQTLEALNAQSSVQSGELFDLPFYAPLIRFTLPKWAVKAWLEGAYADPSLITEQILGRYHDMLLAPGVRKHVLERLAQTKTFDLSQQSLALKSLQPPTLLLWGKEDQVTPVNQLNYFEQMIPKVQSVVFKNTGHLVQEENATESVQALLNFLKNAQSSELESKSGNNTSAKPN